VGLAGKAVGHLMARDGIGLLLVIVIILVVLGRI
jgi:hypothetical protein